MSDERTLIEKLQQLEHVKIYDLICDPSIWKSVDITGKLPHIERLWCQLGKYKLSLDFIHPCKREEALLKIQLCPSSTHVIEGQYEMGIGFGNESPKIYTTILTSGGMYYEVSNKDCWQYIRPISVCSSVTLHGESWGEETDEQDTFAYLHNDRVYTMLEYFKGKFQHTVKSDNILQELGRGDWVMLDEKKMNKDDYEEYGDFIGIKGFVIKNSKELGLSIRFGNDRVDEFNPSVLVKLKKEEN
jgi:hypothetical protein